MQTSSTAPSAAARMPALAQSELPWLAVRAASAAQFTGLKRLTLRIQVGSSAGSMKTLDGIGRRR